MANKDHLDELREYQEKQYSPGSWHIQKGELPYQTKQVMKQGAKKDFYLLFLAAPASLCLIVMLGNWLSLGKAVLGTLLIAWAVALIVRIVIILRSNARRRAAEKAAKEAKMPKKKKKRWKP